MSKRKVIEITENSNYLLDLLKKKMDLPKSTIVSEVIMFLARANGVISENELFELVCEFTSNTLRVEALERMCFNDFYVRKGV